MKKGYEINFTTKTITITKIFSELAQDPMSTEYTTLLKFKKDFPEFSIITIAPKTRKKNNKISYDKMVKYIYCQKDSTVLLKRFAEVRELSKSSTAPYNFVYKWFIGTFPSYDELPEFDNQGNIVPKYNIAAADLILEEVKESVA